MHLNDMEIDVSTIQSGIPATNCTGVKFLFDWKNNMDYEILEQMEGDNIEIEIDRILVAKAIKNERFNSLVCLTTILTGSKIITMGRRYQILE